MADLLTHVLVAYVIGSLLAWHYEWFSSALVTVVMAGALLPDLRKIYLVLPGDTVSELLGIPFSWAPLHHVGGVLVVIAIVIVVVPHEMRVPVGIALSLGTFQHFFFDSFLYKVDGLAFEALWPITTFQYPVDGFYKSWDMVPLTITLGLVAIVLGINWYKQQSRTDRREPTLPTTYSSRDNDRDTLPSAPVVTANRYETDGVETGD